VKQSELPFDERELLLHAELREQLDLAEQQPADAALYAGVLDSVRAQARLRLVSERDVATTTAPLAPLRRGVWTALVAVGVAAAAASLLFSHSWRRASARVPEASALASALPKVRSELVLAAGAVNIDGRAAEVGQGPLEAGQHVATARGRACLGIDPQIDVCLDQHSEIALDSLARDAIVVRVLRGTAVAALAPRPSGHTFSLATGNVSVTAHGTVFAVGQTAAFGTSVVVMDGSVEVARGGHRAALLSPHSRLRLDDGSKPGETALVGRSEEAQLLALIAPRALWQDKALGMLDIAATGSWVEASIGDLGPLPLPLRVFVPLGSQRLVLRDAAGVEVAAEVAVAAGQTRRVDGSVLAVSAPKVLGASAPESAAGLLEVARRELGRGGAKAALPYYRRLLSAYPKSPEAFTVLITVGQLELEQGAPGKALSAFDAYVKRGGPLGPEALAGKIRALRALRRAGDERAAIERYLASYPNGFEAPALTRRLEAMP
jgi:FecR protein/Tetratricopeptide repeat